MVSLKDIAEACGVSVATVSKALNNHSDVSQSRREQIKKKANELGYLPNMAAKALKTKSTHDIGILFADAHNSGLTHPFFSEVLEGLKSEAEEKGYDLTFINTRSKMNRMSYLEHCLYRNVDGVVIACVDFLQPEVVELAQSRLPVVTIDHLMDSCATISSNNLGGMQKLTESSVTSARMAGFYRTLEAHGIDIPDHYVVESPYLDDELSYEKTKELLALPERPTCIMYPDDYTCIGGMNAIREAGLRIPEDISVTGYDGVQIARMMSPKITTVKQNMRLIGQMAADKVIELIEKPRTAMRSNRIIDGEIFEGESVAMINK